MKTFVEKRLIIISKVISSICCFLSCHCAAVAKVWIWILTSSRVDGDSSVRSPFHVPFVLMNKDLNLPAGVLHPSPCWTWWLSLASHCLTYTTWGAQNGHSTPGFSPSQSWEEGDREFLWSGPPLFSWPTPFVWNYLQFFFINVFVTVKRWP